MISAKFLDFFTPSPLVFIWNWFMLKIHATSTTTSVFPRPPPPSVADIISGRSLTLHGSVTMMLKIGNIDRESRDPVCCLLTKSYLNSKVSRLPWDLGDTYNWGHLFRIWSQIWPPRLCGGCSTLASVICGGSFCPLWVRKLQRLVPYDFKISFWVPNRLSLLKQSGCNIGHWFKIEGMI